MAIQPVDLRVIDAKASNIYEGIIVASIRARVINSDTKIEYNALVSTIPSSGADDDSEDIENPAQLKISQDFDKREKPHIEALNELLEGNIEYEYKKK